MSAAQALAAALLHALWVDAALAFAAAVVLGLMARASAAARHRVGMAFLMAMALLPGVTFLSLWVPGAAPVLSGPHPARAALPLTLGLLQGGSPAAPPWLGTLWALGVSLMLARMAGGWWVVRDLLHTPWEPLPRAWLGRVEALAARLELGRPVEVRLGEALGMPLSARVWRPVIWLPVSALSGLTPAQLEALLAHELAHVARLDWIWNALQRLVEALLFFHPGVWWLSARIRREREHACDDVAVALCGDAIALAEALATLEGLRTPTRILALAANGGSLMERIRRLLAPTPPPSLRWAAPLGALAVLGAGALLATQTTPQNPVPPVPKAAPATPAPAAPPLAPGQTWVVTDDAGGVTRVYRQAKDTKGGVTESYTENGKAKSITPEVRRWVAEQERRLAEEEAREAREDRHADLEGLKDHLKGVKVALKDFPTPDLKRLEASLASLDRDLADLSKRMESLSDPAFDHEMARLEQELDRLDEALEGDLPEDEDAPPPPPKAPKPPAPPKAGKAPLPPAPPAPPKAPKAPPAAPAPPAPPK